MFLNKWLNFNLLCRSKKVELKVWLNSAKVYKNEWKLKLFYKYLIIYYKKGCSIVYLLQRDVFLFIFNYTYGKYIKKWMLLYLI